MSLIERIFRRGGAGSLAFKRIDLVDTVLWRFTAVDRALQVFFTTRKGGVSAPPYESLNLGFHVGDAPENVRRNREIVADALGIDPGRVTCPRQQHTARVQLIEDEGQVGSGAFSEQSRFDPCDGLATSLSHAPILLHFADCAPVVLAGADTRGKPAVAVLHAGRKGVIEGVIESGVRMMAQAYNILPESLTAAIGPAIGACCYQVDEDIVAEFASRFGPDVVARSDERVSIDMQSAAEAAALEAGLRQESIHVLELCTCCDGELYSHRRDGLTGRHGAIAWIGEG